MVPHEVISDEQQQQISQFLTTEHTALQTARSATIFDANGRATLFLTAVSSALVAIAFIGQVSNLGSAFFIFALVLLPSLCFVGVVTFVRVLQSAIEDNLYARGMNRIRYFFVQHAPPIAPYLILSINDDASGTLHNMGIQRSPWQLLMTTAGMVAVVNSVLIGVFLGLLANRLLTPSLLVAVLAGVVSWALSVYAHFRYQMSSWRQYEEGLSVLSPSSTDQRS